MRWVFLNPVSEVGFQGSPLDAGIEGGLRLFSTYGGLGVEGDNEKDDRAGHSSPNMELAIDLTTKGNSTTSAINLLASSLLYSQGLSGLIYGRSIVGKEPIVLAHSVAPEGAGGTGRSPGRSKTQWHSPAEQALSIKLNPVALGNWEDTDQYDSDHPTVSGKSRYIVRDDGENCKHAKKNDGFAFTGCWYGKERIVLRPVEGDDEKNASDDYTKSKKIDYMEIECIIHRSPNYETMNSVGGFASSQYKRSARGWELKKSLGANDNWALERYHVEIIFRLPAGLMEDSGLS
jgi:hypothetical protein